MTHPWKTMVAALAFTLIVAVAFAFWPLFQAHNAYAVAEETFDSRAQCAAANEVAYRWARLGFAGKSSEWRDLADHLCRSAYPGSL